MTPVSGEDRAVAAERGITKASTDAPVLASMTPAAGIPGRSARVTFTGSGFNHEGTTVNVAGGPGSIRIELPFIEVTDQSLTVWFAIYASATPGDRLISITTPNGTTSALPFTIGTPLPTIESFTANPPVINATATTTLSWPAIRNATRCSINNGVGDVTCGAGSVVVQPGATTEYMLSAVGPGGREWIYATVNVEGPPGTGPSAQTFSTTFAFTGGTQPFIVPAGVTSIRIDASGAQGGTGRNSTAGGLGGRVEATIAVTPGETLTVLVGGLGQDGGNGAAGFNGGGAGGGVGGTSGAGGGGATDIRRGAGLADRLIVAGGGGASGNRFIGLGGAGGFGGDVTGANGANGTGPGQGVGGQGGTAVSGGTGGGAGLTAGTDGALGQGGSGGGTSFEGGGGGGGGFFGGGGGQASSNDILIPGGAAGGGGGSSFAIGTATNVTHQQGVRSGNGVLIITWQP